MQVQHSYNSSTNGWILLTHVSTLSVTKERPQILLGKNRTHDFRTSRCAGYLLDHSGDEGYCTLTLIAMQGHKKLYYCGTHCKMRYYDWSIRTVSVKDIVTYLLAFGIYTGSHSYPQEASIVVPAVVSVPDRFSWQLRPDSRDIMI